MTDDDCAVASAASVDDDGDSCNRDSALYEPTALGCLPCKPPGGGGGRSTGGGGSKKCLCGKERGGGGGGEGCSSKWCCGVVANTVKKTAKKF